MDEATARRLIALNRTFYQLAGASFDRTRQSAWPGWSRLVRQLPPIRPLTVLDAGCGNGRLARFLVEADVNPLRYTGVDFSPELLGAARDTLREQPTVLYTLVEADFLNDPSALPAGPFDFVALFGVLHHTPGVEPREALIRALAARVAPGGVLAFTAWRFDQHARFREHVVAPPTDLALEPGDVLLDWRAEGKQAVRYCHALDDIELDALVEASELPLLDAYRADGHSGDLNDYRILRKTI